MTVRCGSRQELLDKETLTGSQIKELLGQVAAGAVRVSTVATQQKGAAQQ
jgi:hypothetical protein